jgi:hypothetical protein
MVRPEGLEPPAYRFEGSQKRTRKTADPVKSGSAVICDGSLLCNEVPFSGIGCTTLHIPHQGAGQIAAGSDVSRDATDLGGGYRS